MIALAATALVVLSGCGGGTGTPVADSTVTGPSAEVAVPVAIDGPAALDEKAAAPAKKKPKAAAPARAKTTAKPSPKPSRIIKLQVSRRVRPKVTPKPTVTPTPTPTPTPTATATATPTASTSPAVAPGMTAIELEVLELTNAERAKAGCAALRGDDKLALAARDHSTDMGVNDYFAHNSQDGTTPWDRIRRAGYDSPGAENIAAGYTTAAAVMDGWMKSPGHKANILNCNLKALGVGYYKGTKGYGTYWTQDFGFS
jgi:uncharacterized protein YkwD